MPKKVDVYVSGGGTLYMFHVVSKKALKWVKRNVNPGDWNPQFPDYINVEHRYAQDLAQGMCEAGLVVV